MNNEITNEVVRGLDIDFQTRKINNIREIFSSSQYEKYFNIQDNTIQSIIIDNCIDEIYNKLLFCLKRCSRILPNEEYDESLDEELFDEIDSLPYFFEILNLLFNKCNSNTLVKQLFLPQFFYGFKKCNGNSKFVQMINEKLSFVDDNKIIGYRNIELTRILTEFRDKEEFTPEKINYLLRFLSNYTYDDSLYQYLSDSNLINRYYNVINNLFRNLLSEKYKELKIGADNCRTLLTNLFMIECDINIPLKFDLLIDKSNLILGQHYKKSETEYIVINYEKVSDVFYESLFLVETIFHEKRHYEQAHDIKINYSYIQFIKDNSLISLVDNYYDCDMNYDIVSIEVDARMFGRINFHKWLKKISPNLAKEKEDETRRIIKKELMLQKRPLNRKVNNQKNAILDDLFESIPYGIKRRIIINTPLLSYEYDGDNRRYCTLDLIIKKYYYQKELNNLDDKNSNYLKIAQKTKLYSDLISKRVLTYENILDDLNKYKELYFSLTDYFYNDELLHKKFILEVKKFYSERLPILIIINKINKEQLYNKEQLFDLLKYYKCKILKFMSGQNDDILDIINQAINTSNKRM